MRAVFLMIAACAILGPTLASDGIPQCVVDYVAGNINLLDTIDPNL